MELFKTLRDSIDAYTTEPVSFKVVSEVKLDLIVNATLENKPKIILDALEDYLGTWFLPARVNFKPRPGVIGKTVTIDNFGLRVDGKKKTIEALYSEAAETLTQRININAYLKPFQEQPKAGIPKATDGKDMPRLLKFSYSGGGDDGSYDTDGYWLERYFWEQRGHYPLEKELARLTQLVEIIAGDFNGDGYRSGDVEIDLETTTIEIREDEKATLNLTAVDYFSPRSYSQSIDDVIQPYFKLSQLSYLILDRGTVYYASDLAILGKAQNTPIVKAGALTTQYSASSLRLQNRTLFKHSPLQTLTDLTAIELKTLNQALYVAAVAPTKLLVVSISYPQTWLTVTKISIPVVTEHQVCPLDNRSENWLQTTIDGLITNELECTIDLLAEIKASELNLA